MTDQTHRPAGQPGWGYPPPTRPPSGLFPSGRPTHPTYREAHPVRPGPLLIGLGAGGVWMLLFGLIASTVRGYGWWTVLAGALAWAAAVGLARVGDRGVAVGVAISAALGWSVATVIIALHWATNSDWPLW